MGSRIRESSEIQGTPPQTQDFALSQGRKTAPAFIQKLVIHEPASESRGLLTRLMERFRTPEGEARGAEAILVARRDLGRLGVSIQDLNRKIERLEQIKGKWLERGSLLDLKT